jgi:hypothetical protein
MLSVIDVTVRIGLTVNGANFVVVPAVTETVPATAVFPVFEVVTVKVPVVEPAGIVMLAGAVDAVLVSVIVTTAPLPTAAPLRVILPVVDVPLVTT